MMMKNSPDLAALLRPIAENVWCGDQAAFWSAEGRDVFCLADGLGHGKEAETAARAAVAFMMEHWAQPWSDAFAGCDRAIAGTRGAALAIAEVNHHERSLTFAGVGNVRAIVAGRQTRMMQAYPGIVGSGRLRVAPEKISLKGAVCFVMFTDGVDSRLDLSHAPSTLFMDMSALAATVVEKWGRTTDDVGVIAWRCPRPWFEEATP